MPLFCDLIKVDAMTDGELLERERMIHRLRRFTKDPKWQPPQDNDHPVRLNVRMEELSEIAEIMEEPPVGSQAVLKG